MPNRQIHIARKDEAMDREAVLERIKKLNALANNEAASEGEVENALRFARKLMDEYAVAESEVSITESHAQLDIVDEVAWDRAGFAAWEQQLPNVLKYVCDVKFYYMGSTQIRFVGFSRDVAVAKELYKVLLVTIRTMARMKFGKGWTTLHRSYAQGFTTAVTGKARDMAGQARQEYAIVLCKMQKVDAWFDEKFPKMEKKAIQRTRVNYAAYNAGSVDGRNCSLNTKAIR